MGAKQWIATALARCRWEQEQSSRITGVGVVASSASWAVCVLSNHCLILLLDLLFLHAVNGYIYLLLLVVDVMCTHTSSDRSVSYLHVSLPITHTTREQ